MEKVVFRKGNKQRVIEVKRHRMAFLCPLCLLVKRKMWKHLIPNLFTTILIFPAVTYRIWLSNELWKEEARKLIMDDWSFDQESKTILDKYTITPSLENLDLERYVYFTNGKILKKIQIVTPKGFKEWNAFYNLSWESGMYWVGFLSAFFLITGIGDLIFNMIFLSKGGKWNHSRLKKKGYKPYTNVDEMRVNQKDGLKRKFQ